MKRMVDGRPYEVPSLRELEKEYHAAEAERIAGELAGLGPWFAEDGVVRMVLRERIEQEKRRARGEEE